MFTAKDFQDKDGNPASPETAAKIANAKLKDKPAPGMYPGKFIFDSLGRTNRPVIIGALSEKQFISEVQNYLLSSAITVEYHPEINVGEVFVNGRSMGNFQKAGV